MANDELFNKKPEKKEILVEITPEQAKHLLSTFTNDEFVRPLNPKRVAEYAADMKEGKWEARKNDPLIADENNTTMLGGRHRLAAFVKSGARKFRTWVKFIYGNAPDTNKSINSIKDYQKFPYLKDLIKGKTKKPN